MGKSIENLSSVTRIGVDLAKNSFQVHAVDASESSGDMIPDRHTWRRFP